jgi:hypothetical protein
VVRSLPVRRVRPAPVVARHAPGVAVRSGPDTPTFRLSWRAKIPQIFSDSISTSRRRAREYVRTR